MLQKFITWIREVISKMFHLNDAKRAVGADIVISAPMQDALALWQNMFLDIPPWLDDTTQSMGLPAAIASELARLTLVEFQSEISGSQRADWLNEAYQKMRSAQLRNAVELACAAGGLVFKPYPDGDGLAIDCVPAWRFFPTATNNRGEITGAIFSERVTRGKAYYTRLEYHAIEAEGYVIRNYAFRSENENDLGMRCGLDAVPEWAALEPELIIRHKDGTVPEQMLFAYFRLPFANTIDPESPLGVSAYSRAVNLIKEADRQYSRVLWEFEGSELAVDASVGALPRMGADGKPAALPKRQKRLFRELAIDGGQGADLYKVFSPEIRDSSLFNGLDKLLKRIEFSCSLAYGTLSDPQAIEKTATEIKSAKQRSYAAVCEIQAALEAALSALVGSMDFYATLYKLAPAGDYELSFTWGDGIMEDTEQEFMRRKQLVDAGYLKPEKLLAWYFGVSEEEAAEMLPAQQEPLGFEV